MRLFLTILLSLALVLAFTTSRVQAEEDDDTEAKADTEPDAGGEGEAEDEGNAEGEGGSEGETESEPLTTVKPENGGSMNYIHTALILPSLFIAHYML